MFDKTARHYDLLYTRGLRKDYAAEVDWLISVLPPSTRSLLDVACGTGLHLEHLSSRFECTGVDVEPEMVAIATQRCPDVPIELGDMTTLDLGDRRFDAIVCLFSSIGYVRTEARLRDAVAAMARHLNPGGVLVAEPWLTPDVWNAGHLHMLTVDEPDVKICRMSRSGREGDVSVMDFHYLVATADGIEHTTERHELGLFTWDQYRAAFEDAGLTTTVQRDGGPMSRGVLLGHT
jgi:ubiquinone/menaquinone biosynthesis C-methylase UbiE